MKTQLSRETVFLGWLTVVLPLLLTLICIVPLLSPLYATLAQQILHIELEPSSAAAIFHYVRQQIVSPESAYPLSDLTPRELAHLADVSALLRQGYLLLLAALLVTGLLQWRCKFGLSTWRLGLRLGATFTLVLLGAGALLTFAAWESAFAGFHRIFFASGSWQFRNSATLIQNFPPRFWLFSTACLALLMCFAVCCIFYGTHRLGRNIND